MCSTDCLEVACPVNIVTQDSGFESQSDRDFSLLHSVQTGSGAHPASYRINSGALSLTVKRPGLESESSPLLSVEVKNMWRYTFTPAYALIAWCLINHREKITFTIDGYTSVDSQSQMSSKFVIYK
jgi:hypothetical protein